MPDFSVTTAGGSAAGTVSGPDHLFGIEPNVPVMHQVVTAQLAAKRQGTQSTKTRAEVRGGGAKPWRQKGTGRARAGSIRAPHWRGGGVALGPKPRKYTQRTPKKMIRLALSSALSDRAGDDKVRVIDDFGISEPKTKDAIGVLRQINVSGRVLVVLGAEDTVVEKSFRNLQGVQTITHDQLNTYDVLVNDYIVFTKDSFEATCAARPGPEARRAAQAEKKAAAAASAMSAPNFATDGADSGAGAPQASGESAEQPAERSEEAAIANHTEEEE